MSSTLMREGKLQEEKSEGQGISVEISGYGESPDDVERTLLRARDLINSTISTHRSTSPADSAALLKSENGDAGEAVMQLIGGARHRVSVALSGNEEQAEAVSKALLQRSKTSKDAVAVRFLCTPKALETRLIRSVAPHSPAWEVRVIEDHLVEAVVVDGRTALVHNGPRSTEGHIVTLEDPAAARTLELLLAGAWRRALFLEDYLRLGSRLRSDLGRRILERLCAGCTDAVAAREMKVSLRTYRRHVAEIMRDLGASSRFQAGARAVELRLLPEGG
ncbi:MULTISPECIES: helix-turn-helix transcriptional regulator [unclassified Streptomyces]|uniref:helix-turn-helix transcriptional regulator n=1 Tax=unclassified Streptomyces TaxID=2593676 RepID=UPI002E2B4345|nr:hypothetical protein [Streptomyces sp. NBC_00273]